jgi:hypothetical protein
MPRLPAIAAAVGTAVRFGRAAPPQIHAELKLEEEEEEEGEAAPIIIAVDIAVGAAVVGAVVGEGKNTAEGQWLGHDAKSMQCVS